jgi:signal transduction histidine kinase
MIFFIYSKYINKKKANEELQSKNEKINQQHKQLEEAMSDLQEKEKGLIEANITKDKFFSIIAHDLKNPLHAIVLSSDLLLNRFKSMTGEQLVDLINSINKAGLHLSNLLENLLNWARAQSNKINVAAEYFEINDVLDNVIGLQNVNAEEKSVKIINNLEAKHVVFFDKNMLKTVLRNLISNAIKFSFAQSSIVISAEKQNSLLKLSISDSGVGMKPEDIDKLFRIDVHHSTKGTNAESGTGLGLLLCKDFVEMNGGSIKVESTFGEGTTFTIFLPMEDLN